MDVVNGLVGHPPIVLSHELSTRTTSRQKNNRTWTNLEDVVVLELLCERDTFGDRECIREILVWELVHLDGVNWCGSWGASV